MVIVILYKCITDTFSSKVFTFLFVGIITCTHAIKYTHCSFANFVNYMLIKNL